MSTLIHFHLMGATENCINCLCVDWHATTLFVNVSDGRLYSLINIRIEQSTPTLLTWEGARVCMWNFQQLQWALANENQLIVLMTMAVRERCMHKILRARFNSHEMEREGGKWGCAPLRHTQSPESACSAEQNPLCPSIRIHSWPSTPSTPACWRSKCSSSLLPPGWRERWKRYKFWNLQYFAQFCVKNLICWFL